MASKTRIEVQRRDDYGADTYSTVAAFEATGGFVLIESEHDIRVQVTPIEEKGY